MIDTAEVRKARGAFFTPQEIADFLTEWAVRSKADRVLEPSCGEAVFLLAVAQRFRKLGADHVDRSQVLGVDLHAGSVEGATGLLTCEGFDADLRVGNFFDLRGVGAFDAVVGNPPYIRYQQFTGDDRARAQRAALAQGVRLDGLASSWAAFVAHAAGFLNPTGRLALVLPAELLSVNYAAPVRRFLMERFKAVRLVMFETRVFPGVMEEVVLLLAEGTGPTDHFEVYQAKGLEDLPSIAPRRWFPGTAEGKWLAALLPSELSGTYSELAASDAFSPLLEWGETDLGMVTGNNRFFTLSASRARELGLDGDALLPISPPSSRHLRGLTFTDRTWREMRDDEARVYLFYPRGRPSPAAQRYIDEGETQGVDRAYKCRVRKPWWRVPQVGVPDLFLTYMNHDAPRLVANKVRYRYLNSVHGVSLRPGMRQLGTDLLPIAMLNSFTLLDAELVGRSYGGGMLKIEPKEADKLRVPSPRTVEEAADALRALRPQLAKYLRNGQLVEAARLVDRVLLIGHLKTRSRDVERLRTGRMLMFERRRSRSKAGS